MLNMNMSKFRYVSMDGSKHFKKKVQPKKAIEHIFNLNVVNMQIVLAICLLSKEMCDWFSFSYCGKYRNYKSIGYIASEPKTTWKPFFIFYWVNNIDYKIQSATV